MTDSYLSVYDPFLTLSVTRYKNKDESLMTGVDRYMKIIQRFQYQDLFTRRVYNAHTHYTDYKRVNNAHTHYIDYKKG